MTHFIQPFQNISAWPCCHKNAALYAPLSPPAQRKDLKTSVIMKPVLHRHCNHLSMKQSMLKSHSFVESIMLLWPM